MVNSPILQMREQKLRKANSLPRVTQQRLSDCSLCRQSTYITHWLCPCSPSLTDSVSASTHSPCWVTKLMQASTMMGMSPRLICCSCSPVPPPPAAPPMAAFHAEKSSRLSPCRYRVLRPQRPESEPATEGPLRHPGSQVPDFPEPPAGGSNTQPRQGPCTREGTLRKQAGGGPAGCGLCSRKRGVQSQG